MKFYIFFIVILMLAEHFPSNHAAKKEIDNSEQISEMEKLLERAMETSTPKPTTPKPTTPKPTTPKPTTPKPTTPKPTTPKPTTPKPTTPKPTTASTESPKTTTPKEIDKQELISEAKDIFEHGQKILAQHRYNSNKETLLLYCAELAEIEILQERIESTSKQERLKSYKLQLEEHHKTMDDLEKKF
uniref:Microtubule-associated protein RP/EB family member 1-like n=1 Tax=Dermatophagoides pteronyssinus TaxID=6956 RepID=A0A6P6YI10_DERPT|nr:microtubule-associated protein RP/EB family member 1-like [Dermatophagoides pteronyssinus]